MFDYNGILYGYLQDDKHDKVTLDDRVKRIKMSEFLEIKEEIYNNENKE